MKKLNKKRVKIKIPDAIGDTIAASGVLDFLFRHISPELVRVYANHRDLLAAVAIDILSPAQLPSNTPIVHLNDYLLLQPHSRRNRKHHILSMIEVLREQLKEKNDISIPEPIEFIWPRIEPSSKEKKQAQKFLKQNKLLHVDLPIVWIAPKATTKNRSWYYRHWLELEKEFKGKCHFIELLGPRQRRVMKNSIVDRSWIRTKAAIMKHCTAGITVDTYAIHLAGAIRFTNVIALLGSSHPECVLYPGMKAVYQESLETRGCQPCGNHGYDPDLGEKLGLKFRKNGCVFRTYKCMEKILLSEVSSSLKYLF